ncbi:MAG: phasin family protein [Rhodospirillales bacterium]|nr:phasin family protein [Alphaproteobacteria bacterium]MCB9986138.1 phasin family protein [Rhodospirillales bacterium]USO07303.1 MAG: phasin family protein [Rhodospirillales bacterium]
MVRSFFDPSMIKQMMPKQGLSAAPAFDLKQLMETQRKNVQAMTDAIQLGMEGVQHALSRQAEMMGRMVQDNSTLASALMAEGTPEQKVQRHADMMRKSYENTIRNAREVSDIIAKSGEEAAEIINRRVSATLAEFKSAFDRDTSAADATDEAPRASTAKPKKPAKAARRKA